MNSITSPLAIDLVRTFHALRLLVIGDALLDSYLEGEAARLRICRNLGIEVIIFRGNDRNRRRGFHNTYVFYQRFRQFMERNNIFSL